MREGSWILTHFKAVVDKSSKKGNPGEVLQNTYQVGVPVVSRFVPGEVLQGWIDGLYGICELSKIELLVPPHLAFGDDLTVKFEIDILQVSDKQIEEPSFFDVLDENQDGQVSFEEFSEHFMKKRPNELGPDGKPPLGLFFKDDGNQNGYINWEEFSGPKGTSPPSKAQVIMENEKNDPELSQKKKGDPLDLNFTLNMEEMVKQMQKKTEL